MRPFRTCAGCLAQDPEWVGSSGTGSLYSWTVVWRPQHPSFVVPYAPAVVELDEGWYLLSAVVGCEDDELSIGMRLEVEFHPVSEEITLPYFTPLRSGGTPASANGRAQGS
ncbi:MAG TPA: OB-fold domain-containing protein [Acidimicrobiales bacterium]|nr:OB-fold domain-containing protein [Acidimicrobiales bacterium]